MPESLTDNNFKKLISKFCTQVKSSIADIIKQNILPYAIQSYIDLIKEKNAEAVQQGNKTLYPNHEVVLKNTLIKDCVNCAISGKLSLPTGAIPHVKSLILIQWQKDFGNTFNVIEPSHPKMLEHQAKYNTVGQIYLLKNAKNEDNLYKYFPNNSNMQNGNLFKKYYSSLRDFINIFQNIKAIKSAADIMTFINKEDVTKVVADNEDLKVYGTNNIEGNLISPYNRIYDKWTIDQGFKSYIPRPQPKSVR